MLRVPAIAFQRIAHIPDRYLVETRVPNRLLDYGVGQNAEIPAMPRAPASRARARSSRLKPPSA